MRSKSYRKPEEDTRETNRNRVVKGKAKWQDRTGHMLGNAVKWQDSAITWQVSSVIGQGGAAIGQGSVVTRQGSVVTRQGIVVTRQGSAVGKAA